jgi:hypothetical protein
VVDDALNRASGRMRPLRNDDNDGAWKRVLVDNPAPTSRLTPVAPQRLYTRLSPLIDSGKYVEELSRYWEWELPLDLRVQIKRFARAVFHST